MLHAAALRRDLAGELRAAPHGELRKHHGLRRRAVVRIHEEDGGIGRADVHVLKSIPTLLIAPGVRAGPSMPMVRKESNSAAGLTAKNAGLVGPTLVPKGVGTCIAGGMIRLLSFSPYSA